MIIKKKTNLDLSNEIKGGDGNGIFKNVMLSFLQKIGLVSIRCELETEMSIDISTDEMQVLFKREDENLSNLERDIEKIMNAFDRYLKKSIDTMVVRSKQAIKGFREVNEFYELMEEQSEKTTTKKERHEKVVLDEDKEQDQDKEETIIGFHDSDI